MNIVWDKNLIERYSQPAPRYTSYPTAVEFHSDFKFADYEKEMQASAQAQRPLSLYLHLPFCAHICYYCGCNKVVTKDRSRAQPYLDQVFREIEKHAEMLGDSVKNQIVEQCHWGGGTPTFISHEQMQALMKKLKSHFTFRDDDKGDYSIEIDPRETREDTLTVLRELGFNRISFGVQDLDEKVQKAVNRVQPLAMTKELMAEAKRLGFRSTNIDLIYGLPFQTLESFMTTLETIIELSPDRLSIFNYAHLPERFKPQRRISQEDLPKHDEKLAILEQTIRTLEQAGYEHIGMDHFAKPQDTLSQAQHNQELHRNFQGYTTHSDCDLLGIGVSSISQVGNSYFQNTTLISEYMEQLADDKLAINRGLTLTLDDHIRRHVITELICHYQLDKRQVEETFAIRFDDYFYREIINLESLVKDELVLNSDQEIRVTDKGRLLIRNICVVFDHYRNQQHQEPQIRFSQTI